MSEKKEALAAYSKFGKIWNRYVYWGIEELFRRKVPASVVYWSSIHDGFLPHLIWSIACGYDICDAFIWNPYAPKCIRTSDKMFCSSEGKKEWRT